jgi:hypothetical protein
MRALQRGFLTLLATAVALLLPATAASAQVGDRDCADFATQAEAQAYFDSKGGSPENNVDQLDENGDGIPCEDLPAGEAPAEQAPAEEPAEQPAPEPEPTPAPAQTQEEPPSELPFTGPAPSTALLGVGAALLAVGGVVMALFRYRGRHVAR